MNRLQRPGLLGIVYAIYFVPVILGLRAWWARTRIPRPEAGTVLEGAAA